VNTTVEPVCRRNVGSVIEVRSYGLGRCDGLGDRPPWAARFVSLSLGVLRG
jgi:hypothetical protein